MTKIIEAEIVEASWQEMASLNEKQAIQLMDKLGDKQSDLLAFVITMLEELSSDGMELGIYLFTVVYRIFEKSSRVKLKRISQNKIITAYEKNEAMLLRMEEAHERFFERIAEIETSHQPHIMQYVLECIMEADQAEEPLILSEDDIGTLFLVLKTVIDILARELAKSSRS